MDIEETPIQTVRLARPDTADVLRDEAIKIVAGAVITVVVTELVPRLAKSVARSIKRRRNKTAPIETTATEA